jgi:polyphenol oxidase
MGESTGPSAGPIPSNSPGSAGTRVTEEARSGPLPCFHRAEWSEAYPWLIHGITQRGRGRAGGATGDVLDFRLRGPAPAGEVLERWDRLREATGMDSVVHSRQVHGAAVRVHEPGGSGLLLTPPCDGHLTAAPGVLLTVSVADCVPVFLVAPGPRAAGLLHAGWRGTAAGIVEEGVRAFRDRFGVGPGELHVHLGPAISREEYEVGPEVHRGLGLPDPGGPAALDLRAEVAGRAARAGVSRERIGISTHCTRREALLFSHRGGDEGRQVAFLGMLERSGAVR